MSTKTQQVSTNSYDPNSMNAFTSMTNALGPAVSGYINNPFGNPFFQQQQQMGTQQANFAGQTAMSNIARNTSMSGIGSNSPAALEMMNNQMRANSNTRANLGFMNPVNNALLMQQNAMGTAANYKPLQTGQTNVQTTSGLGTWLPQVAGAAIGAATGGMGGGGLMSMFGGGGSTGTMSTPWFQTANSAAGQALNIQPQGNYNFGTLQAP